MRSVLVTGSKGQLGKELENLSSNYSSDNFFFADRTSLDISDFKKIEEFVAQNNIQVIINCAAYTNVDGAEEQRELADEINYLAVKNLAEVAKNNQIKLIHISTDYVFDGFINKAYIEDDLTNPQNYYGKSKLKGEKAIQTINPSSSIIIRTSWLYSSYGNNFVKTILRLSKEKERISVVSDQIGSPTNANDLAKLILKIIPLINSEKVEIYNYSNKGFCSWFEFAKEIIQLSKKDCIIEPILAKDFKTKAYRPAFSRLNTIKIEDKFDVVIPHWKVSLKKVF